MLYFIPLCFLLLLKGSLMSHSLQLLERIRMQGMQACAAGYPESDNPYTADPVLSSEWQEGWTSYAEA